MNFHSRNLSTIENTNSYQEPKSKSPRKKSQFIRGISEFKRDPLKQDDKLSSKEYMCQSDIVVGTNFNRDTESLSDDNKAFSDVHDMFFIHELFKDSEKFAQRVLNKSSAQQEEE